MWVSWAFGLVTAVAFNASIAKAHPPNFAAERYAAIEYAEDPDVVEQWMAPWRERSTVIRTTGQQTKPSAHTDEVVVPEGATDLHIAATLLNISGRSWTPTEESGETAPSDYTHQTLIGTTSIAPVKYVLPAAHVPTTAPQYVFSEHRSYFTLGHHRTSLFTAGVYEYDENGSLTAFFEQSVHSFSPMGRGCAELLVFPTYDDDGLVTGWRSLRKSGGGVVGDVMAPVMDGDAQYYRATHRPSYSPEPFR